MAMAKKKLMNPSHVLIFVEGDTDEVQVPSSLKGINEYQKLLDLYNKARFTNNRIKRPQEGTLRGVQSPFPEPCRVFAKRVQGSSQNPAPFGQPPCRG